MQSSAAPDSLQGQQNAAQFIDDKTTLLVLLDELDDLPSKPPSLYFDLEQTNSGRKGSVSILTLYIRSKQKIFVINVHALGETAFNTTNDKSLSLRSILESNDLPKVFFNIGKASHALFIHYSIRVDGIRDLQLMEFATRNDPNAALAKLEDAIERDVAIEASEKDDWRRARAVGRRLFGDVRMLPHLYDNYNDRLCVSDGRSFWWMSMRRTRIAKVRRQTIARIESSQRPEHGWDQVRNVFVMQSERMLGEAWKERWNMEECEITSDDPISGDDETFF